MNDLIPSWRDRLRPVELLVFAGVVALFTGLVVLGTTQEIVLSLVFFGIAFIASLVTLALVALAVKPGSEEKVDLDKQDHG